MFSPFWPCCACDDRGTSTTEEVGQVLVCVEPVPTRDRPPLMDGIGAPWSVEPDSADADRVELKTRKAAFISSMSVLPRDNMDSHLDYGRMRYHVPEAPAEPDKVWTVYLVKEAPDEAVGLDLAIDHFRNVSVGGMGSKGGAIQKWNFDHPALAVMPGDIVEEVNGNRDAAGMLPTFKVSTDITLTIRRLARFSICMNPLGPGRLGLQYETSHSSLRIVSVLPDGVVHKANKCCNAGHQLVPGNIIEEVNGIIGFPNEMARVLELGCGEIWLTVRRDIV